MSQADRSSQGRDGVQPGLATGRWGRPSQRSVRRRSRWMAALLIGALAPVAMAQKTVIVAGQTLMPDGTLASGRAVVIERGKIAAIADAASFADDDPSVLRYPDSVLSPGLIALGAGLGVAGQQSGGSDVVSPGLRAADAVNASDPALRAALEQGVTAALVVPDPTRIIGGRVATFRTHVTKTAGGSVVDFLNADGPAFISMGPQVLDVSYGPTSRAGAAFELREALRKSREKGSPVASLLPHQQGMIALCASIEDVDLVLATTTEAFGGDERASRLAIFYTPDDPSLVGELAQEDVPFIVGPLTFNTPSVSLLSVAGLSNAGATVAFSLGATSHQAPEWLRVGAALCVKHGMDPAAARRGLTSAAAQIAGLNGVGAISPGAEADLVLFSGDPLLLSSTVQAVFVRGQRVHGVRPSVADIGESEGSYQGGVR
jgi:imidazolonepropionase-like amidohydrolase